MRLSIMLVFAILAIGLTMAENRYNACHQDCCDRSFSNYGTMTDICDINLTTVAPSISGNYISCMDACDNPKEEQPVEENKYNACHQDCCDRSFSTYSTMADTCDIDPETVQPNIYSDYQICMTACDRPEPILYDESDEGEDDAADITPNDTAASDKQKETAIIHATSQANKSQGADETAETSGGIPFCAPALAFLALIGLYGKK